MTLIIDNRTEWNSWNAMRHRCRNKSTTGYRFYGGVGIDVCDRWYNSFDQFLSDMGKKPSLQHVLARHDASLDFAPENCFWRHRSDVRLSPRRTVTKPRSPSLITFGGETKTAREWAAETGLDRGTITRRLSYGWTPGEALGLETRFGTYRTEKRVTDPETGLAAIAGTGRPCARTTVEKAERPEIQKDGTERPAWLKTPPPRRASTGKRR